LLFDKYVTQVNIHVFRAKIIVAIEKKRAFGSCGLNFLIFNRESESIIKPYRLDN